MANLTNSSFAVTSSQSGLRDFQSLPDPIRSPFTLSWHTRELIARACRTMSSARLTFCRLRLLFRNAMFTSTRRPVLKLVLKTRKRQQAAAQRIDSDKSMSVASFDRSAPFECTQQGGSIRRNTIATRRGILINLKQFSELSRYW
jgi:hypothetical protein